MSKKNKNIVGIGYIIGFLLYPLLVAILPFKTVLTPVLSIGFAIVALVPTYKLIKQLIKKEKTMNQLFSNNFTEAFVYYHLVLSVTFIIKGIIYAYFGVVYTVIGYILLPVTLLVMFKFVILKNKEKILTVFTFLSPVIILILFAITFYSLEQKGNPISLPLTIIFSLITYTIGGIRVFKSFKLKDQYQFKNLTKIYLAILPIGFVSSSILMVHSYYVTHVAYFVSMLLVTVVTFIVLLAVSIVTLSRNNQKYFRTNWSIYLFFVPAMCFAFIFAYVPMLGILLAFKDYNIHLGNGPIEAFLLSEWVGFEHFNMLFRTGDFVIALKNTLVISTLKIVLVFPMPIFLAILINEIKNKVYKSSVQTLVYLPHFISWAIVGGIFYGLLATHGPVNSFLVNLGFMDDNARIVWYNRPDLFQGVLVFSYAWKEVGYSAIVYLAAIVGIDPALYEAAKMDGANKLKQIMYITIPGLLPTILMLLVLRLGYILEAGFNQVIVMTNENVRDVSEIIGTYVYRIGIQGSEFSFSTAVGLFNSVVALMMILAGNFITKKFFNKGIW